MELERLIHDYAVWHRVQKHSVKTIGRYLWTLGMWLRWLVKVGRSTNIHHITVQDARAFLTAEMERTELRPDHPFNVTQTGTLSDRTIHAYARDIKAFFNWLVSEEYLAKNPMAKLQLPKLEKRKKDVLSVEEIEHLLHATGGASFLGTRLYAIVALLYDSGLRAEEITNLNLGDILWQEYRLRVFGKGRKERFVPFGPTAHRALRRYISFRATFAREAPDPHADALFLTDEGDRLTYNALYLAVRRLGRRAGVPRVHPHLFRHSSAVAYLMNGGDLGSLKDILGHENITTTQVYLDYNATHLSEQHRKASPLARVRDRPSNLQTHRLRKTNKRNDQ